MTHINSFIPPVSSPLRDTSPLLPSLQDPDTLRVSFPASGPLPIPMTNDYLFRALLQRNQRPRCKQRGIKLAALQSSGVFDPRGSRQMSASSHLARCSRE